MSQKNDERDRRRSVFTRGSWRDRRFVTRQMGPDARDDIPEVLRVSMTDGEGFPTPSPPRADVATSDVSPARRTETRRARWPAVPESKGDHGASSSGAGPSSNDANDTERGWRGAAG